MNLRLPWNRLTDEDRAVLAEIEGALADPDGARGEPGSIRRLCTDLQQAVPQPNDAFRDRLKTRLIDVIVRTPYAHASTQPDRKRIALLRPGFAAGAALVVALAISLPVLGQTVLKHIAPREVATMPTAMPGETPPALPSPPPSRRWMELAELQDEAGFKLLVPTYIPPGCTPTERFLLPRERVAYLTYSCVFIAEQAADAVARPLFGDVSTEQVVIGGQPALYVEGAWGSNGWNRDIMRQVILERGGITVRVSAPPPISKDELFRIAASMQ